MDSLEQRWRRLEPHVAAIGPQDATPRPAVLLFHGCGGLRPHLPRYAEAAKAAGWRAFIVDSYASRGIGRTAALGLVCTGVRLRGRERAGDVLAAIHGLSRRADIDAARLAVAGWSHGGWAIMEMLAADRSRPGALGLSDAAGADLSGVGGAILAYAYVGPLATARMRPWRHAPRTLAVIARRDHLTTVRNAQRVFGVQQARGMDVETWIADGTHAFDEPTGAGPMRHDPRLTDQSLARFTAFLAGL